MQSMILLMMMCLAVGGLPSQERKWTCPQCKKPGQIDWKFCPLDGVQLTDGSQLMRIEEAEVFALSKGIILTEKKEQSKGITDRSVEFKAQSSVSLVILQFPSVLAAKTWKDMVDGLPFAPAVPVLNGAVAFVIHEGPEATRAEIYGRLGGPGTFPKKGPGLSALTDFAGKSHKENQENKAGTGEKALGAPKEELSSPYASKPVKDGLRVELLSFRVGKVRMTRKGRETESEDELGILKLRLTNVTETKKIDYITPNAGSAGDQVAYLEDEFGNKYDLKSTNPSFCDMVDGVALKFSRAMYPEDLCEELLAFEIPVKKASQFTLHFSAKYWKGTDSLRVSFPRDLK